MERQLIRQVIFAIAVLTILLVGSVCGNGSVDLGADVDGSSVLLESSTVNDPMTGVQISGRRRVVAVRKRLTPTLTTPPVTTSQTQTSSGDEIFEPFTAEELQAMKIIAQYPAPTGQIDPALIKLLQDPPIPTPSKAGAQKRLRSTVDSAEVMPVKNRRIDETRSVPISRVEQPATITANSRRMVRKPVTSKPRKIVNRTPKVQGMNILQPTVQVMLEAEAETEQANALTTGVSAFPPYSLGQVAFGITQTIGMLRVAIQADPAIVACPGGVAGICKTANHFTYVLDPQPAADLVTANAALVAANTALATAIANGQPLAPLQALVTNWQNQVARLTSQIGRIHFAFGFIRPPPPPPGTDPSTNSKQYCDVLFNPFLPFIGVPGGRPQAPGGGRNLWQAGHIMGNALGGVNDEPMNFYPQHRSSNNAGGRWGKAEAIALGVAAHCAPTAGAQVSIGAYFTAWDARGIYPTGGHYTIIANAACVAALGAGCTQNGAAGPAATAGGAYVQTFCRWSVPIAGGNLLWTTPVTNGAADRVNNLLPAEAARFFP